MAKPFSITSTVAIEPADVKADVLATCNKLFGNQRGDDETEEEFLNRRVEEWILSWYSVEKSNEAANAASTTVRTQIESDATLRRRKDKPVEPVTR
jgi:hypothetical protein